MSAPHADAPPETSADLEYFYLQHVMTVWC
jgi:hypothetical protein